MNLCIINELELIIDCLGIFHTMLLKKKCAELIETPFTSVLKKLEPVTRKPPLYANQVFIMNLCIINELELMIDCLGIFHIMLLKKNCAKLIETHLTSVLKKLEPVPRKPPL